MDLSRWRRRVGRLPVGLLGMLVLVMAAESFVKTHDLDALDPDDWRYHVMRAESVRNARGKDLLCFGDSLMMIGVVPGVVETRSGLRGYNLAVSGAQPPAAYYLFRRALEAGARPKAVLLECHPTILAMGPEVHRQHWPYLLGDREALELAWTARDAQLWADLVARRVFRSLRARHELRKWVMAAVAGELHAVHYHMPLILPHWRHQQGAQVVPSRHSDRWDIDAHVRATYPADWRPHPAHAAYLRRFLALAEAHGVAVYWLVPPVHPRVQEAKERNGVDAKHEAFVRSFRAEFPGLVVLDGRRARYDPGVFFDPDHLGRDGSFVLSQDIGDALRRPAPADRWVELPRYRARPVDPALTLAPFDKLFPNPGETVRR